MLQYNDTKNKMKKPAHIIGPSIEGHWNDLTVLERLNMILSNPDHFLYQGLVTRGELQMVMELSEGGREYIIDREEQPLFTMINLKSPINTQALRDKLKTALSAVFLNSENL